MFVLQELVLPKIERIVSGIKVEPKISESNLKITVLAVYQGEEGRRALLIPVGSSLKHISDAFELL